MLAAVISFAVAALAFAGTAVALALKASKHKSEFFKQKAIAKEAQYNADEFREQLIRINVLRAADQKTIRSKKLEIETLLKLLREHAPDGVAAEQFDRMLQEASGEDGNESSDSRDTVPG